MGVNENLSGWISELETRCIRLIRLLDTEQFAEDVHDLKNEAVESLRHTFQETRDLGRDQILLQDELQQQAISNYQELFQAVVLVEEILTPILLGYDAHDHRGFLWLQKFASETNFPLEDLPFVTAKSGNYYWIYPELRVMGMPIGDIEGLLGWPDIAHELGHTLLALYIDFLSAFTPVVKQYFRDKRDEMLDLGGQLHPQSSKWLTIAQMKWGNKREGTWREEIACDLIGTYFMGTAYGWQHLRLVTNRDNHPYYPLPSSANHSSSHPADHARMEAILAMLKIMKLSKEAKELNNSWHEMLSARHFSNPPQGFRVYYPRELIKKLANIVYSKCQNHKFVAAPDQDMQSNYAIIPLVNRAWSVFQTTPTKYGSWEKKLAGEFWKHLEGDKDHLMIGLRGE